MNKLEVCVANKTVEEPKNSAKIENNKWKTHKKQNNAKSNQWMNFQPMGTMGRCKKIKNKTKSKNN